jgi:outer membrane autotransporter protein
MKRGKILGVALLLLSTFGPIASAQAASSANGSVSPNINPSTWTSSTTVDIGSFKSGHLTVDGDTVHSGNVTIDSGRTSGSGDSSVTITNDSLSQWLITGNLTFLSTIVNSSITQNGGTVSIDGSLVFSTCSVSPETYNLNGGTLALGGITASGSYYQFNFNGGTLQANNSFTTSINTTLTGTDTINTNGYNVTWAGSLQGTGALVKTGDGTLTITGKNTSSGGTTISGGTIAVSSDSNLGISTGGLTFDGGTLQCTHGLDSSRSITLNSGGGTVDVDSGYDVTLSGTISGKGKLTKTGEGTLLLSGANDYSGGTDVETGYLGGTTASIKGDLYVASGGTVAFTNTSDFTYSSAISGAGTVYTNGQTLLATGTITPTSTKYALTINGNLKTSSTTTLNIATTTSACSVLHVTSAATVDGGTVSIGTTGGYTTGTKYTFLTADILNVDNAFDVAIDSAFLTAALGNNDRTMWFTLASSGGGYVDEAHTGNQYAVASYLDAHKSGATGDFATVLDALNLQTGDGARAAFNAMSGEIHGSLQTITIENSEHLLQTVASRMRTQSMAQGDGSTSYNTNGDSLVYVNRRTNSFDTLAQKMSGWTTWAESYGVGAAIASNGNASGLTYSTGGLMLGMERYLDENTLFGFGGGYAASSTTLSDRSDWGSIDGGQVCAYLHRDVGSHYLTGIAAFGYNQYSTKRYIDFGDIDRTATANYHGGSYSAYFETGRNVLGRFTHLQPFAALEYIGVQQNAFTEQGADSIDLDVDTTTANAMRGILGSRVFNHFRTKSGHLVTVNASAAWRHEFLNDNRVIDAAFTSQTGNAFAVSGVNIDRDAAIVGAGLNYALSSHCSIYGNYDLLFSQNYTAHTGLGGFQYAW